MLSLDFSAPKSRSWRQIQAADHLARFVHHDKTGMTSVDQEQDMFFECLSSPLPLDMEMVLARLAHPSSATAVVDYGEDEPVPFMTAVFDAATDRLRHGDPLLFDHMLNNNMVSIWTEMPGDDASRMISQLVPAAMRPAIVQRMLADIPDGAIDVPTSSGFSPLGLAVNNGDFDLALGLIQRGASVSWTWNDGQFEQDAWLRFAWETMTEKNARALERAFKNRG